jgi:hypothetical protein
VNVHPAATETFLSGSYCDYWRGVYLSLWRHSIRIYTAYLLHNSTEAGGLLSLTPSPRRGEGARMCPKAYGAGGRGLASQRWGGWHGQRSCPLAGRLYGWFGSGAAPSMADAAHSEAKSALLVFPRWRHETPQLSPPGRGRHASAMSAASCILNTRSHGRSATRRSASGWICRQWTESARPFREVYCNTIENA